PVYAPSGEPVGKDGHYRLRLSDGGVLTSRTVVIATGASYRRLGIPRLENLQGKGVFYGAAASEAPAMRGRNVLSLEAATPPGRPRCTWPSGPAT
ncbi:MAG: hypothetical protein ACTHPS_19420, partial [Streptosporangiaceae bacterium]